MKAEEALELAEAYDGTKEGKLFLDGLYEQIKTAAEKGNKTLSIECDEFLARPDSVRNVVWNSLRVNGYGAYAKGGVMTIHWSKPTSVIDRGD